MSDLDLGSEYKDFLNSIKAKVRNAQIRASLAVNEQLLRLYWSIGKDILAKQALLCWGSGVIDQLSADLTSHFPGQRGFSPRNLRAIRRFAETWPEESIWQQPVAKLPWSHNLILIEKLKSNSERLWYAEQSVLSGWSRSVLVHQIESGLIERQGKAPNNFSSTLPSTESDLAVAMLKDPLNLSFLEMTEFAHERHLERALVDNIKKFLIALGAGFAFMGEQVRVEVGEQEFYTDLIFYHTKLHCYVVIDLKTGEFTPEHKTVQPESCSEDSCRLLAEID